MKQKASIMWKAMRSALLWIAVCISALRLCDCKRIKWYESSEFRADWEPYMRRSNTKPQCLKLYDKALKAGRHGRVDFTGPAERQIAADVIAIRWFCIEACRAACTEFRRRPGSVKTLNEPREVAVAHGIVMCMCRAVRKFNRRGKAIMYGWGRCKARDIGSWRPKRNAMGKPMSSFKENRKLGRWDESRRAARRRQRGPAGGWLKRGHSLDKIYRWFSPCAQARKGGGHKKTTRRPRRTTTRKRRTKKKTPTPTIVVTLATWKDTTPTTSVTWTARPRTSTTMAAEWTPRPRTTRRPTVTTEAAVATTTHEEIKIRKKNDTDKEFAVRIYPGSAADSEWFLHWMSFETRHIAGYLIVIELAAGAATRHFHYFVGAATTTIRIAEVPKEADVTFVVKPLGDTITLNATTRAAYSGVTANKFEYRPPALLLLPTLPLHSIGVWGSVGAQLLYGGERKDAASVRLYDGGGGDKLTGRFDGPQAGDRQSALVRLQFPVAQLREGFLSSCGVQQGEGEDNSAATCPGFKFTCADTTATITCAAADVRLQPERGVCTLPKSYRSRT